MRIQGDTVYGQRNSHHSLASGITGEIIENEINGLLANSVDDWFRALNRLVNEEELRRRLAINARSTIEESYSLQVWGPRLVSLVDSLSRPHPGVESIPSQSRFRNKSFLPPA